jgi:ankyrin repeat protein
METEAKRSGWTRQKVLVWGFVALLLFCFASTLIMRSMAKSIYRVENALDLAQRGKMDQLAVLLDDGLSVNTADGGGITLLMCASMRGHENVARMLVERGAEVNQRTHEKDYAALHAAAGIGAEGLVAYLLDQGADPNGKAFGGITPLHSAAGGSDRMTVLALLAGGANVDIQNDAGDTAMHIACRKNALEVLQTLCEHGARVDIKDTNGDTVIDIAKDLGLDVIVEYLSRSS